MKSDGILLIDKGFGLSSFEAVERVRSLLPVKKAGHTGTLDPGATGLLIITLGAATKLSAYLTCDKKRYSARIKLGEKRDTFDRFGKLTGVNPVKADFKQVANIIEGFRGEFNQLVPPYSAVHYQGKRMYKLARKGVQMPRKFRKAKIHDIELVDFESPFLELDITCSSGTYIRSIAHQIGEDLGCGACLQSLRRTAAGRFSVDQAITIRQLEAIIAMRIQDSYIMNTSQALDIPWMIIEDQKAQRIKDGLNILREDIIDLAPDFGMGQLIGLKNSDGNLLAIGNALMSSESIRKEAESDTRVFEYKRVI